MACSPRPVGVIATWRVVLHLPFQRLAPRAHGILHLPPFPLGPVSLGVRDDQGRGAATLLYPGFALLMNDHHDPSSSTTSLVHFSLAGVEYVLTLFLDGTGIGFMTVKTKSGNYPTTLFSDRTGLPPLFKDKTKASTWQWLAMRPVPATSDLGRWSRKPFEGLARDRFGGSDVMLDVSGDGSLPPVKTAITFQEWLRCHGIKESAAMALPAERQVALFLKYVHGEAMSRAWMEAQPWLVASTMLVPGRAAFGWIAPSTVDVLLPEWYRKPENGIDILDSITTPAFGGNDLWRKYWLESISKPGDHLVSIFLRFLDSPNTEFPAWFFS